VPRAKQTEVGPEQDQPASRIFMLARAAADRGLTGAGTGVLDALALAERGVGEDHIPLARQIREQLLVARPRLAVLRKADRPGNGRMASGVGRYVEVRGHVEVRPALERQLLDAVARSLDRARDSWIERSPLQRSAEHLPQLLGNERLPLADFL